MSIIELYKIIFVSVRRKVVFPVNVVLPHPVCGVASP